MTAGYSPIDISIAKGIDFLDEHQLAGGDFILYYSSDEDMTANCVTCCSTYTTAFIGLSLSFLSNDEKVKEIIKKSIDFLYSQLYYGVWNYSANYGHQYKILPFDVDTTSIAAPLLVEKLGGYSGDKITAKILTANRDKNGLFYTWIVPRLSSNYSRRFLRIAAHVFINPVYHSLFWSKISCQYADIDMGINANVLSYLGDIPETQEVINEMNSVILENREATCDKWYYNPFVIYHFFTRCYYLGINKLEPIRQLVIDRILARAGDNGCLGGNLFNTALAVCSLQNLNYRSALTDVAIQYIINAQKANGSWERWGHYGAGKMNLYFGSEEVTTAICLEALGRYRDQSNNN